MHQQITPNRPTLRFVGRDEALRDALSFRGATHGPNGSAHFDLPTAHTYALVCSTAFDEIAVLLDEGHGHEDHVFEGSKGLGRMIDYSIRRAQFGDDTAIEVMRSFAVEGIKRLRAARVAEGRA